MTTAPGPELFLRPGTGYSGHKPSMRGDVMKRARCANCGKGLVKVPFVGWRHEASGLQACADGRRATPEGGE